MYDAVLPIAFGGPTAMHEVRRFLDNVLRGRPLPPQRVAWSPMWYGCRCSSPSRLGPLDRIRVK
jgi:protoheme ferro-lyase